MKKLIMLTLIGACVCSTVFCQLDKDTLIKRSAVRIADCILIERTYKLLQQDSAKMKLEIVRRDNLIQSLETQVDNLQYQAHLLTSKGEADKATIKHLEDMNVKLEKRKVSTFRQVMTFLSGVGVGVVVGVLK